MATGRPAGAVAKKSAVVDIANVETGTETGALRLRMALQAQVHVPLDEHPGINRAMRAMANSATLPHSGVFKNERSRLFAMALGAALIQTRHGQAAGRFHDVHAVRIVAIDAIHLAFEHRVMLWEMELGAYFLMALEAGFGVFAGIDDEFFRTITADHGDVLAARAVAGFTAALAGHVGNFRAEARMRTGGEDTGNVRMAVEARLVANVSGALDLKRDYYGPVSGTGIEQQNQRPCTCGERGCGQVMQTIQLGIAHGVAIIRRVAI